MWAAYLASAALGDLPREGLKLVAAVLALIVTPVLLVVVVAAVWIGSLLFGVGGSAGGSSAEPPPVPPAHLAVMVEVGRDTGVPWELIAAIASVESGFGANMATSWAGAIGYGQFMPASWAHWGGGGDPYDYRDAIPAMARYLLDHDVRHDIARAVYGYNHSWEYVALVLGRMATYASLGPDPASASPLPASGASR